jgi:hypothetical protein
VSNFFSRSSTSSSRLYRLWGGRRLGRTWRRGAGAAAGGGWDLPDAGARRTQAGSRGLAGGGRRQARTTSLHAWTHGPHGRGHDVLRYTQKNSSVFLNRLFLHALTTVFSADSGLASGGCGLARPRRWRVRQNRWRAQPRRCRERPHRGEGRVGSTTGKGKKILKRTVMLCNK